MSTNIDSLYNYTSNILKPRIEHLNKNISNNLQPDNITGSLSNILNVSLEPNKILINTDKISTSSVNIENLNLLKGLIEPTITSFTNASNIILNSSNSLISYINDVKNDLNSNYNTIDNNSSNYNSNINIEILNRLGNLNISNIQNGDINKYIENNTINSNLTINGDTTVLNGLFTSNIATLESKTVVNEALEIVSSSDTIPALTIKQNNNKNIVEIYNNTSSKFTINNIGNFGIGATPNNSNSLEILGDVNCTSGLYSNSLPFSYSNLSNIPLEFIPSAHSHSISDINGLSIILDAKQSNLNTLLITSSNLTISSDLNLSTGYTFKEDNIELMLQPSIVTSTSESLNYWNENFVNIIDNGISKMLTNITGTPNYYYSFTSTSGANSITFTSDTICDVLIVGGGGGGGRSVGSGGGAGGLIYTTYNFSKGTYNIIVGKGGIPMNNVTDNIINNGQDSLITYNSTIIFRALGGGQGNGQSASGRTNVTGGSGAGGCRNYTAGNLSYQFSLTGIGIGFAGGSGTNSANSYAGGGGGGAGGVGLNATTTAGGNGGPGYLSDITGYPTYYAAGGGGSGNIVNSIAVGGSGIGGNGGASSFNGSRIDTTNGKNGTGSGGGGCEYPETKNGYGGSGIVIIRIKQQSYPSNISYESTSIDANSLVLRNYSSNIIANGTLSQPISYDVVNSAFVYEFYPGSNYVSFPYDTTCDILMVGGGGSGGTSLGTGGNSGNIIYSTDVIVPAGNYNIIVGEGGSYGQDGKDTIAFGATSKGGRGIISNVPSNVKSSVLPQLVTGNSSYSYYTFTTNGSITFSKNTVCDLLIVGGGGSGAIGNGGGSSGGILYSSNQVIQPGTYPITVGTGGVNGNGGDSVAFGATATGGLQATDATGATNSGANILGSTIAMWNENKVALAGGTPFYNTVSPVAIDATYSYYAFTTVGNSSITFGSTTTCDILIVGGGGSGGGRAGGGGGAGAVIYLTDTFDGTYDITVGDGGASVSSALAGNNGEDSIITKNGISIYLAKGGGGGGGQVGSVAIGKSGGSSGGTASGTNSASAAVLTTNIPSNAYGNVGGKGDTPALYKNGGGGGGAETPGIDFGNGGDGKIVPITGNISKRYGGGGGGGALESNTSGNGGLGGGGDGSVGNNAATAGSINTGSGGGGAGYSGASNPASGAGGSGIIIIRVPTSSVTSITAYIGTSPTPSGGGGIGSIGGSPEVSLPIDTTIIKYPLVPYTTESQDITYSSYLQEFYAYKMFNGSKNIIDTSWVSLSSDTDTFGYNTATSEYIGIHEINGYKGDWVRIDLKQLIILKEYTLYGVTDSSPNISRSPGDFKVFGSKDNLTHFELDEQVGLTWSGTTGKTFEISSNNEPYRYYTIVINKISQAYNPAIFYRQVMISEWELYGYPLIKVSSGGDGFAVSIRTPNELFAGGGGANGGSRVPSENTIGYGGNSTATTAEDGGDGIVIIRVSTYDVVYEENGGVYRLNDNNIIENNAIILNKFDTARQNLIAWYKFDNDFTDSSGNGNNLVGAIGNPTLTTINSKNSLYLDGSSYFDMISGDTINLNLANKNFSLSVWIKRTTTTTTSYIMGQGSQDIHGKALNIRFELSGELKIAFSGFFTVTENKFTDTNWHNYTFTLEYNSSTIESFRKIYVDGVLQAVTETGISVTLDYNNVIRIGAQGRDTQNLFKGYMSDLRIYNKTLSKDEVEYIYSTTNTKSDFLPYATSPAILYNNLRLWYKFSGNLGNIDSSIYSLNATVTGIPVISDGIIKITQPNYLQLPSNVIDFNNDITICFWYRFDNEVANNSRILDLSSTFTRLSHDNAILICRNARSSSLFLYIDTLTTTNINFGHTTSGQMIHLTWIIRKNGIFNIYKNGILLNTIQGVYPKTNNYTYSYLGKSTWSGEFSLDNQVSLKDFRIYNRSLTEDEIYNIYNQTTTTSLVAYSPTPFISNSPSYEGYNLAKFYNDTTDMLAWYKFSGANGKTDSSGNLKNATVTGTPVLSGTSLSITKDNYLRLPDNIIDHTKDITFCFWYRFDNAVEDFARLLDFGKNTSIAPHANDIIVTRDQKNSQLRFFIENTRLYLEFGHTTSGDLIHVTWIIKKDGTWIIYKNSIEIYNEVRIYPSVNTYTYSYLGKSNYSGEFNRNHEITLKDFRIYNRALSPSEIDILYNQYTIDEPLQTFYNDTTDMYLWYKFNGDLTDSSGNSRNAIGYNTPTFNTTMKIEGTSSISFAGGAGTSTTSQYLTVPSTNFSLWDGFTVSCWVMFEDTATHGRIIDFGNGQDNNNILFQRNTTTNKLQIAVFIGSTNYNAVTSNEVILNNSWMHVAWVITKAPLWVLYVNGVAQSLSNSNYMYPNNLILNNCYIAKPHWTSQSYFKGNMDDFRIYKRALTVNEIALLANRFGGAGGSVVAPGTFTISGGTGGDALIVPIRYNESFAKGGDGFTYNTLSTITGIGYGGIGSTSLTYNPGGRGTVIIRIPYQPYIVDADKFNQQPTQIPGTNDFYYAFTSTTGTNSITFRQNTVCDILVVGGGGSGGTTDAGGGGAGGLVYIENKVFSRGTYNIVVGDGGATSDVNMTVGNDGNPSYISLATDNSIILKALGGGGGGNGYTTPNAARNGGSGGGGPSKVSLTTSGTGIQSTDISLNEESRQYGFGHNGGAGGGTSIYGGGGGGGAGGAGSVGGDGIGGIGKSILITGTSKYYAGGGGGGHNDDGDGSSGIFIDKAGGLGGGGLGKGRNNGGDAEVNTGGGGGGGGAAHGRGGKGGSGIVIIRWTIPGAYTVNENTNGGVYVDKGNISTVSGDITTYGGNVITNNCTVNNDVVINTLGYTDKKWKIYGNNDNQFDLSFDDSANNGINWTTSAKIRGNGGIKGYVNFTGMHHCKASTTELYDDKYIGYIVSSTKQYQSMNSIYDSSNIQRNIDKNAWDALPIVTLATEKDKKVFGIIAKVEDDYSQSREEVSGNIVSYFEKKSHDRRLHIAGVGEGGIWVCNYNGDIESGDYITTSPIPGIGMKQDDDLVHGYTVGKATMDCDFNPKKIPVKILTKIGEDYDKDDDGNYIYSDLLDVNGEIIYEDEYEIKYITLDGTVNDNLTEYAITYKIAFIGCSYTCS